MIFREIKVKIKVSNFEQNILDGIIEVDIVHNEEVEIKMVIVEL